MNQNYLEGKVAVVSGAGRGGGIGAAIARELARLGARVVVSDLCAAPSDLPHGGNAAWEELEGVAAEVDGLPVKADVTRAEDWRRLMDATIDRFGRLDILVNNAGAIIGPAPVQHMAEAAWRRLLEINATGVFLGCQAAIPHLIAGGGGHIVNISSLAAIRPRPFMSAYAAGKAAVVALTGSLAQELGEAGINVNAILPGDIDTGMKQWGMQLESMVLQKPYENVVGELVARIPRGRLGVPADVAQLVGFLVSPAAEFITGQAINLTGGRELS